MLSYHHKAKLVIDQSCTFLHVVCCANVSVKTLCKRLFTYQFIIVFSVIVYMSHPFDVHTGDKIDSFLMHPVTHYRYLFLVWSKNIFATHCFCFSFSCPHCFSTYPACVGVSFLPFFVLKFLLHQWHPSPPSTYWLLFLLIYLLFFVCLPPTTLQPAYLSAFMGRFTPLKNDKVGMWNWISMWTYYIKYLTWDLV